MNAKDVEICFGDGIEYGHDQANVDYPVVFPTVQFELVITDGLHEAIEKARTDAGITLSPESDGWYNAYLGINDFTKTKLNTCIEAVVVNEPDQPDNEECYLISLSEDEQKDIFAAIDAQCRKRLGKSCEELLKEAEKEMEEED